MTGTAKRAAITMALRRPMRWENVPNTRPPRIAPTFMIAVIIPALITDADLRGLQDKVTNTAVVRR